MKRFFVSALKNPAGVLFFLLFILSACSQEEQSVQSNQAPKLVEVEIKLNPKEAKLNQEVEIQAIVTQDNEPVEDADDVKFEIWKEEGGDQHDTLEATHIGNGVYAINIKFHNDGLYYIIAHTNARDLHTMPKIQVIVGK
ncbi:FixH family protein [Domibacillus sp. PGB-M46]|uniref:FixH family protein n=1 Tax=Domibacillus sp. PGB-M46 TaxID=2910255 RepID=UPI001F5A3548|nr:FixH family protein [Domibacillus sp. PGB-M46]MCI2255577.1 FixH family protein [Domibacillus sp. PGB-M46]